MANNASVLRIKQVRSTIGRSRKQREVLKTLGLRRIGHIVERPNNAAVRGAVSLVAHMVSVEGDMSTDEPVTVQETTGDGKAGAAEKKSAKKQTKKKATKKKKTTKKKAAKKKTAKAGKKKAAKKKTAKKKAGGGDE